MSVKPYMVTATDSKGLRETFAREAASVDHLRSMLEREGFRDIELVDDELSASLRMQRSDAGRPKTQADFRLEAKLRRGPNPLAIWLMAIRKNWILIGIALLAGIYGQWSHRPILTAGAVLALMLWVWLVRSGLSRAETYNKLLRAYASGEWARAAALTDKMLASQTARDNENIRIDLTFRRACLWARQGRLEEALASVQALRESARCGNGMFECRVASIYYAADRMDDFLRCLQQAFDASGHGQLQQLDLAFAQARVGTVEQAEELLRGIERKNLSALHAPVLLAAEGICRQREGAIADSVERLTQAVDGLSAFAANPATWPFQGMVNGHLAIALSQSGRRAEARTVIDRWRPVAMVSLDPISRVIIETEVLG